MIRRLLGICRHGSDNVGEDRGDEQWQDWKGGALQGDTKARARGRGWGLCVLIEVGGHAGTVV